MRRVFRERMSEKARPLPTLDEADLRMNLQHHLAQRAGEHWDIRFQDPKDPVAYSWAIPKAEWPVDRPVLAIRQPDHRAGYMGWSGQIDTPYGPGQVASKVLETTRVHRMEPGKVDFTHGGTKYRLHRTESDKNWLLRRLEGGEVEKKAYHRSTHEEVVRNALHKVLPVSPALMGHAVDAAKEVDVGIRAPHWPWNDRLHAFPSGSRSGHLDHVSSEIRGAASDVARALAEERAVGGGLRTEARMVRGMRRFGEATHTLIDVAAHYDKPKAEGVDSQVGRTLLAMAQPLFRNVGGGVVSGMEHIRAATDKRDVASIRRTTRLDQFDPSNPIDRGASDAVVRAAQLFRQHVDAQLVAKHHMTPDEAASVRKRRLSAYEPSTEGSALGGAWTDQSYLQREARKLVPWVRSALR